MRIASNTMALAPTGTRALASTKRPAEVRDNWAGNQTSTPDVVAQPETVRALQGAVRKAIATNATPCVLRGSMHSWSPVAVQKSGTAITLANMMPAPIIDVQAKTVTVGGAMKLADLHDDLAAKGLALEYAPTIEDVTVAGAAATGTHGAARSGGIFAEQILDAKLIDGRGRNIQIDGDGCWHVPDDGGERQLLIGGEVPLAQLGRHLGTLGAIYEVKLACTDAFDMEMVQRPENTSTAFGPGYENLAKFFDDNEHADVFWFRHNGRALMRTYNETCEPREPRGAFMSAVVDGLIRTHAANLAFQALPHLPFLTPLVRAASAYTFGTTTIRDRSDKIATYLPGHAKSEANIQVMEYGVPMARMPEAMAIAEDATKDYGLPIPMFLRRVGDHFYFEMMWMKGYPDGEKTARELERRIVDAFGADAMPHQGKHFFANPWTRVPAKDKAEFQELRNELDPHRVFTSTHMRDYFAGRDV